VIVAHYSLPGTHKVVKSTSAQILQLKIPLSAQDKAAFHNARMVEFALVASASALKDTLVNTAPK